MPETKLDMESMTPDQIKKALSDIQVDAVFNIENVTLGVDQVNDRVSYHVPSEEGTKRHAYLSAAFADLMNDIDEIVPGGREKSIVFTKLEEAKFWASAGVARNKDTV